MKDKIHILDDGGFETESFRELNKRLLEASDKLFFLKGRGPHSDCLTQKIIQEAGLRKDCKCKVPEPMSKCSENGISAYCNKCGCRY
jgi:hypothetical protein